MGYNREDFIRIKAEFSEKYIKARKEADMRKWELYEVIPEVQQIDSELSKTGTAIMNAVTFGEGDVIEKIEEVKRNNARLLIKRAELLVKHGYPENYSDIHYDCTVCGDTGYVNTKMCDCMKKALTLAGYESSGLAGLIRSQSFDNFSLDYYKNNQTHLEKMKMVFENSKKFAEGFNADTYCNFVFMGSTGLGKTHISTAIAKTVIERGFDVMYATSLGMIGDFEAKRFGNGAEKGSNLSRYYDADLLIIDDFGTELSNQFTVSCFYDVINSRMNNRKCTIINTNLKIHEIESKYGERISSRLMGEYHVFLFAGIDIRKQKIIK